MTIKELIKLIEQWARDRGLDKNGTVEGQLIKTAEEVAELIIGISKDDIGVIKDSVGDVFVTLVVGNMIDKNLDLLEICQRVSRSSTMHPKRKFDLIYFLNGSLHSLLAAESYTNLELSFLLESLLDVCDWYELDFVECVESAYSEIANRKGVVRNGTFIKESDL